MGRFTVVTVGDSHGPKKLAVQLDRGWHQIYVGIFQSLIVTCRMHGIDPYVYLVDVMQHVAVHPAKDIKMLIPRLWMTHFADEPMRSEFDSV